MFEDRIILVEGDSSKWYEQAIFIVRKNVPKSKVPIDFVAEAEKIVNNYIRQRSHGTPSPSISYNSGKATITGRKISEKKAKARRKNRFDLFVNSVLLIGCIALLGILMYAWMI